MLASILKNNASLLIIVAVSSLVLLSFLGSYPFKDYDEAVYAYVAWDMYESGNFLYPTLDGNPWLEKPPLILWLATTSAHVFGFSEFALRLPGALAGIAIVFLTYALANRMTGSKIAALVAATVLATTSQFMYSARELRFDMPVAFGILLAAYCFYRGWDNSRWYLLMGVGAAAAILFKSIVAIFIPLIFLVYAFVYKRWDWLTNAYFWIGVAVAVALAAPWHIIQLQTYGTEFLSTYIGYNSVDRYFDPILGARNASALYFPIFAALLLEPWFAVFAAGIIWFVVKRKVIGETAHRRTLSATLIAFVVVVTLFNFSQSKLFYYFDPVYPFFAIFIGTALALWQAKLPLPYRRFGIAAFILLVLIGAGNTVWQLAEVRDWPRGEGEYAIAKDERAISEILNNQTNTAKLYALFHDSWNTFQFYTRSRSEPIEIIKLDGYLDPEAFFLVVPTHILNLIELNPVLLSRAEVVYSGERLVLFAVRKGMLSHQDSESYDEATI